LGNVFPIKMIHRLGNGGTYVANENGLQVKGGQAEIMTPDEYVELIQDPIGFVAKVIAPRKYSAINQDFDLSYENLCGALDEFKKFANLNAEVSQRVANELGMPILSAAACYATPDIILDHLRDFVGTINDIRRHPDEFFKGCEALFDWSIKMVTAFYKTPEDGRFVFSPLHLPTYLKPKDFEKFYLPHLLKMVKALTDKGYTQFLFMENDWRPYLDMLQDLPDAKIAGLFEHGDIAEIKKSIGNKMCVIGGMPTSVLNFSTKEACIDYAKNIIDTCAPDGGYIFSVDRSLLALKECNPENLKAVNEYVKTYGVY
ncbi:MAG: uroporphyrinogen decarboxylase family protein, partial [Eubacterium sp.]